MKGDLLTTLKIIIVALVLMILIIEPVQQMDYIICGERAMYYCCLI